MPRPIENPPNPWAERQIEWDGEAPPAELQLFEEEAKTALAENTSPDVGFRWSVNPYRGCYHGCAYCYARTSHQYLSFGAGTDFERKIVVKMNIAEKLRDAFEKKSWKGEVVVFSGNTDCYQPIEASYRLTRACLDVCAEYRNPVAIITKSSVIRRDVDVLARLATDASAHVTLSIAFARDEDARKVEPWASPPSKRFETLRILNEAGIPVGISLCPVIPGLTDEQIPEVLGRAREAGASYAFMNLVRLSGQVLPVFTERIEAAYPLRSKKILSTIQEMRDGKMNHSVFGERMVGKGERWQVIEKIFETHASRLGFNQTEQIQPRESTFRRPRVQLDLFG